MENTVTFIWTTGKIEIALSAILDFSAAKLNSFIKTATENAEEVKQTISEYLTGIISCLNEHSELDKPFIKKYKALLDVVGGRKQTKQEKAIRHIIKNCNLEEFAGAYMQNGKQCIVDGYRLVRLSAPLNLPTVAQYIDTDKAIGDRTRYDTALILPTVKELKTALKLAKMGVESGRVHIIRPSHKGKGGAGLYGYDFGYRCPLVDVQFLIDMLEALPEAEAFCIGGSGNSPIYFIAGDSDGFLLPITKREEYGAEPAIKVEIETAVTVKPVEIAEPVTMPDSATEPETVNVSENITTQEPKPELMPIATAPQAPLDSSIKIVSVICIAPIIRRSDRYRTNSRANIDTLSFCTNPRKTPHDAPQCATNRAICRDSPPGLYAAQTDTAPFLAVLRHLDSLKLARGSPH